MTTPVHIVKQDLERATPESQGISSAAIQRFVQAVEREVHELHSLMLLRHGKVIAEAWWSPYRRDLPHMLFSLSKSFTSTAVGLAVAEGRFSVDDPVLAFFPDDTPAEVNEHLAAMRVRHLLSMSTGHEVDTMPPMIQRPDFNWTRAFLEVPVVHAPGTHFLYNTGATYILAAIVQQTTGMMLVDYLQPRLFEPLGITSPVWEVSPQGINMGGFGLNITTEDIARFGQLYLQKGMWNGQRLIAEAWIQEATSRQVPNGDDAASDWNQGYGYQFWRCKHNAYRGDGAFGQYCIVMPDQDAVLAITAGVPDMQQPLNLVWEHVLPALGDAALPDDPAAQDTLTRTFAGLTLPPVAGKVSSNTATRVSGKLYRVETNDLTVETITLVFADTSCTIQMQTGRGETIIPAGYGGWEPGQTVLFNPPWEPDPAPVVSSGAWTADDTFMLVIRLHTTPFYETVIFRFRDDRLTLETRRNLAFVPPPTHTLTAQLA